jgi:hydrogenase maturation protease
VVIVDALKTGGAPGRVSRLALDEIDLPDEANSMHQLGVNHLLEAMKAAFAGRDTPEVVVIGAEVGEIDPYPAVASDARPGRVLAAERKAIS